jgi:site-specific recombinase XerD
VLRDGGSEVSGRPRRDCSLAQFVDGFGQQLLAFGYAPGTVGNQLAVVGQLGRWMASRGLRVDRLGRSEIDAFVDDCRRPGARQVVFRRGLLLLREHLIDVGAIPADPPAVGSALDELICSYRAWLLRQRGLAEATVRRYEATARRFLAQRTGGVDVHDLSATEVSAFLLAESSRCSVGAAKGHVAELRSLLRYLFVTGRMPVALATAVPPVAGWHNTGIPPTLSAETIQSLLDSCNRSTAVGIRDFAIMLLLARLALRSVEVARLQLEDVNWRTGEITIRGKARRLDRLPLPVDVGEALAGYVAQARPRCELRQVFLTCRAPRRGIRADLVGDVVQRACVRVGVPVVGPHRLRHALATGMVAQGVALTDISQVLRHRDLATTATYAKIDLASLRAVALPWPGALR